MDPKSLYSLKDKFNAKRLQVNISKIKILLCKPPAECAVTPSKYLCGVCKKGVGKNSIFCHHSKSWIHPRCSNIKGHLRSDPNLKCQKFCQEKENTPVKHIDIKTHQPQVKQINIGNMLEVIRFCYLGDVTSELGDCYSADTSHIIPAWKKFY